MDVKKRRNKFLESPPQSPPPKRTTRANANKMNYDDTTQSSSEDELGIRSVQSEDGDTDEEHRDVSLFLS